MSEEAPAIEVRNLHIHYGAICALEDVSFRIAAGQSMALVGRNGAGKSTLLKALAGLVPKPAGKVLWNGRELTPEIRRHHFAYLPQREEIDWNFPITVRGLVEMGTYPLVGPWGRFRRAHRERVTSALATFQLEDLAKRRIAELSGGQQQRAFLARALAGGADVFLLDEPFSGLDEEARRKLRSHLRDLASRGSIIIASHHELSSVAEVFDLALLLRTAPLALGPPARVLVAENLLKAFE